MSNYLANKYYIIIYLFLSLLSLCRAWLEKYPVMLPIAVYTYLRVIVDHGGANFTALRQKEVEFCVSLLREKVFAQFVSLFNSDKMR